ncbi:MAG: hypothetical protein AAFO72_11070 [Pseudomonadota bacterium]
MSFDVKTPDHRTGPKPNVEGAFGPHPKENEVSFTPKIEIAASNPGGANTVDPIWKTPKPVAEEV